MGNGGKKMKLIGWNEIKGEKNGREYDFFQLVIDKEQKSDHGAGVQLLMQRRNNGYSLPTVSASIFNNAINSGVRLNSSVKLYQDFEGNVKLEPDSDFMDIR